jgi:hypothetical protein
MGSPKPEVIRMIRYETPCICGTVFEINGKCQAKVHVDRDTIEFRQECISKLEPPPPIEQNILNRAAADKKPRPFLIMAFFCLFTWFCLLLPVHTWLHSHTELLLGIVIGSWLELTVCEGWHRWLWDRIRWVRWFSL